MRYAISFVFLFITACASKPPAESVKAPVLGFVQSLKINDQPVPNGICFLWFGRTKVPLNEGAFFTTDLPVGVNRDAVLSCDRGFFKTNITLKIDYEMNVQANALNLLAEYTVKLSTERGDVGMYFLGGQVTGQFHLHPLSRENVKKAVAENANLKGLKPVPAIKFDYAVPR